MPLTSGTRLGLYEIVGPLGAGGMGDVYRARDTRLGRDVAIKLLPEAFTVDPERLARFEREARVLASLNHPHIAQIYGVEESIGVRALVLELVDGETLADQIRRGPLPAPAALGIARQIADALDAAHEKGIVHRDLKPSNIALTAEGAVKILDFGLAKDASGAGAPSDLTHSPTMLAPTVSGMMLGTAPYMSPEQARGKTIDKRTDIWAFGCVLYEMLTGHRAFNGDTTSDTIVAILERQPAWTGVPSSPPAHVRHLVERCLEKDPKRRLRDIGDARAMLDEGPPVPASQPPASNAGVARAGWIAAALFLFAAIGIAGAWLRTRAPSGPSVSRLVRLTNGPANDFSPAISPDGKWVAYLSDARGAVDVWVKFVAGGDPVNLTASTNLDVAPQIDSGGLAISPDGSLIAFGAAPRGGAMSAIGTWVLPAPLGGVPRKLLDVGRAARWSPDGRRIAFIVQGGSGGDAIWVADADGANPRELAPKRGGMHKHWAAWSRDSRHLYFNYSPTGTNAEPSSIYRVAATGGPIEPVVETVRRAMFPALTADGDGLIYAANPESVDLGLWWKPLGAAADAARKLTIGVGEYAEPNLSADGTRLVATLIDSRQALISIPAGPGEFAVDRALTLTGDTGDVDPAVSSDGRRLVFSSTRSGNRNLWIARVDGTEPRPLTSGDAIDDWPVFSPDGGQIAFVSDRGGDRGIWLINADGGSPRLVAKAAVLDTISWSRDGQRIVYAEPGDEAPRLSLVTADSGRVTPLPTPGPASGPVWSPTSDIIAYIETRPAVNGPTTTRVQFVDGAGNALQIPVSHPPNIGTSLLAWEPGGRFLAVGGNAGSARSVAWVVEPGSAAAIRKVTEFPADTRIRGLAWSPDGKSLIIGRNRRTGDLILMDLVK
jgi:Tol biopolymer transport system component